ncbi:hypothetical protein [Candidatus Merdisoma sp. JLR.KK006]|uniref:hypothetical protein n=1 Tax=Candidatus Merdisoma sp. JLR.KK006 TaxID=3112626 RepID=UPI002FF239CC
MLDDFIRLLLRALIESSPIDETEKPIYCGALQDKKIAAPRTPKASPGTMPKRIHRHSIKRLEILLAQGYWKGTAVLKIETINYVLHFFYFFKKSATTWLS